MYKITRISLTTAFALGVSLIASAPTARASVILLGFEDTPTGDKDFNDLTAQITGAVLHQTGGLFTSLTAASVNNNGTPFWDNVSGDGTHFNFGNYLLGNGGYSGGPVATGLEYLATAAGGAVNAVYFSGGSTVTVTGGITADHDTLQVCYVANCAATTQAVSGSLTWTPTQDWEVIAFNGSQTFYSDPTSHQTSSFAFAQGTSNIGPSAVPEPATWSFLLVGIGAIAIGSKRRLNRNW